MPRHTVKPMSPIPVDPDGPEELTAPPEPLGAPHHEAHLPPGVERGPATVRAFRMLLGNTLIANVTTSFLWFALTFWAYLETRSVMATAIIGGSYMLFLAVFGMVFGSLVDRHRKKPIMVVSSVVTLLAFALSGGVYVLFGEEGVSQWQQPGFWIFVTVILTGAVVESLRNIALSTTVTLLVPEDERDKANGLVGTVQGVAFMVTSVFSGLSIGLLGMGWTLVMAIALTGISLAHLLVIPIPEVQPHLEEGEKRPTFDITGAMTAIRAVPGLLALILFATFNNLVGGVFMALMDPYGLELFDVKVWGVVLGVTSLGFVIGGGLVAKFGLGARPLRTLLLVNVGVAVVGMLFTIREAQWLYVLGILVFMALTPAAEAAEQTLLQKVVPFRSQGRVFGFQQSVEMGSAPVSAFLIGPIAQYWLIPYMRTEDGQDRWAWLLGRGDTRGIALVFFVAGFIMLIAVLLAFVSRPYRQLTAAYEK